MIKTSIILIITFIIVPIATYYFDEPLTSDQTRILWDCIYICLGAASICFMLSQITGNNSQVDKLWSIIPIIYAWYITIAGGYDDRMVLMAILVTMWGIQLTYNFSRRGAYSWKFWTGEEDYRWAVLREKPELKGKLRWLLFNLFFISFYQNGLLLLITLPILVTLQGTEVPLGYLDYFATAAILFFLVIETIADQQQWNYQQEKFRHINAGLKPEGIYATGFSHTGLWKYMRHPNYMAEQAIWISFYLFSVAASGSWLNWSIAGCLLLIILFQGSSDFSEAISAEKYPAYKAHQERTGRFIPKIISRR